MFEHQKPPLYVCDAYQGKRGKWRLNIIPHLILSPNKYQLLKVELIKDLKG